MTLASAPTPDEDMTRFWAEMADGDIGAVEGRLPFEGLSSTEEAKQVISSKLGRPVLEPERSDLKRRAVKSLASILWHHNKEIANLYSKPKGGFLWFLSTQGQHTLFLHHDPAGVFNLLPLQTSSSPTNPMLENHATEFTKRKKIRF